MVRLEYGVFSFGLREDIEEEGPDWRWQTFLTLLEVDVLKASHHPFRDSGESPCIERFWRHTDRRACVPCVDQRDQCIFRP
jgi:hypothetical protein